MGRNPAAGEKKGSMKFRGKVVILNLILLSLTTGVVGFLLMQRSYRLSMDMEIKSAVAENNLVQASVEYRILDVVNSEKYRLEDALREIGHSVYRGMLSGEAVLFLRYDGQYVYQGQDEELSGTQEMKSEEESPGGQRVPEALFTFEGGNKKNYMVVSDRDEAGDHRSYLYVSARTSVDGKALDIITRRDTTGLDRILEDSISDYRRITALILGIASLLLLLFSRLLTGPLERLNRATRRLAAGDYSARSQVRTDDEIGELAEQFNQMADSVEEHVEELNDMVHRREQFVADFTHEMKTPMTSIIGYADTLRSMELSREEEQTALGYIFSEGKRLERMSQKLFDLLYLKDHPLEKKDIPAGIVFEEVSASVAPALERSGISLEKDIEPGILRGDKELVKTVLINLIDNARKASSFGSVVELTGRVIREEEDDEAKGQDAKGCEAKGQDADKDKRSYRFIVTDHGIGISPEDQKKLFDEFYMVDKSRTRAEGGAGLGLSLVAVILERHGGRLSLESSPGQGSSFTVDL